MGFITFKNKRTKKPIPKKKTDDKTPVKKADKNAVKPKK